MRVRLAMRRARSAMKGRTDPLDAASYIAERTPLVDEALARMETQIAESREEPLP